MKHFIYHNSNKVHFLPLFRYKIGGYVPSKCKGHIEYAFTEGKYDNRANVWYEDMKKRIGVEPRDGTFEDFQRIYKCNNIHKKDCNDKGLEFPLSCSHPPCDNCGSHIPGTYSYHLI